MSTFARLEAAAQGHGLVVLGGFHPSGEDGVPEGCRTLLLIGPDGRAMWDAFCAAPEYTGKQADPLDRWSKRVIGDLAGEFSATAVFPSDQPYPPFMQWAEKTGCIWPSPVGLLVHLTQGLLVSFRGALALNTALPLPLPVAPRPCDSCAMPCLAACPASALTISGYDVAACHGWLDAPKGEACMNEGCAVRLACPVGKGQRPPAQHAFHMRAFHHQT